MRPVFLQLAALAMAVGLSGCGSSHDRQWQSRDGFSTATLASARIANPKIVSGRSRVQCVPYARQKSGIDLRGDAWTWWPGATNSYGRSSRPEVGSVIVLSRTSRLKHGHIAVVTRVVNSREILVEHANWLNRGEIHKDQPVVDVSRNNDWSAVRLWYTPGKHLGSTTYPVSGFVLKSKSRFTTALLK